MIRFHKLFAFLIFLSLSFAVLSLPAKAQDDQASPLVQVRVLAENNTIEPGEEIWIGIEQIIEDHWHTYWRNPGDSGSAPRIKWQMPEGFSISDIEWPTPEKLPYGPLLNYGYSDKVVLLQKLQAPEELPEGPIKLTADFEVLVCKEECIPEFSVHELTLNTGISAPSNEAYIAVAKNRLPIPTTWGATYQETKIGENIDFLLNIDVGERMLSEEELATVEFFPEEWGLIDNIAPVTASMDEQTLSIVQARSDRNLNQVDTVRGVLAYTSKDGVRDGFIINAKPAPVVESNMMAMVKSTTSYNGQDISLWQALVFAILGGLVLNLMPCVFPVLSIKALSLVKIADHDAALARKHGMAYTLGVILSFLIIAGGLIALRSAGYGAGWGFQLQNPIVITVLAYIIFLVSLNLSGYFDLRSSISNFGQNLTQGDGLRGSFFTGILATLVATPCTAPFMAVSIGFALTQNSIVALIIFAALGFGLALPYLLLSFVPALQSRLPKPGAWMEHFKHFLAFPMFGATIWLVWVLSQQAGPAGVLGVLLGMLGLAFGIWILKILPAEGTKRIILKIMAVLALLSPLAYLPVTEKMPDSPAIMEEMGDIYTPGMLEEALETDKPVFVEMTAAWCITCKVNHSLALNIPSTKALFKKHDVIYMIGDWTNYDPNITKFLNDYGRNGVPIYVYYGPRDAQTGERPNPVILPQILTPGIVANTIENSF